ncbi:creatininase family protein [Paenibacillus antri]|uniref:creatininase family protein n=1 Tax=Paenibacillus antri TaxID=2582848 RepID=UPI0013052DFE|nr:creatininase family protein [Paenibacillus antri]
MKTYYEPEVVARHVPLEPIPDEVRAAYLRPGELLAVMERFPVAYQPLGTIEWHGRHNPLGCDSIKAEQVCIHAARAAGGVVMPPLYFAADAHWDCGHGIGYGMDAEAGFQLPGSFYPMATDLFAKLLQSACSNYLARGFRLVVLVSGHNPSIQQNVMDEVCYSFKSPDGAEPVVATMENKLVPRGDPRRGGDHAGGYETSMMLYLCKDRVRLEANEDADVPKLGVGDGGGGIMLEEASAEEGKIRFELQVAGLVELAARKLAAL